ncbi:MAG: glucosaminidase domain-containing protein [Pseudomonadota bacterium]
MTGLVTDFARFSAMRSDAATESADAVQAAAEEFEALFIETMLKSMRAALPEDSLFGGGSDAKLYQEMFDQQLAGAVAGGPGVGLAEVIARQLRGESLPTSVGVEGIARPAVPTAVSGDRAPSPMEFVRDLWPYARRAAEALGVNPKAIVAQAALETGWGARAMRTEDGHDAHNYFGIKADSRWNGSEVRLSTLEHRDGIAVREQARFRAYPSRGAAFDDYVAFLGGSERYADVRNAGSDVAAFAESLSRAGYATDPKYAAKVIAVADSDLMRQAVGHLKFGGLSPMQR